MKPVAPEGSWQTLLLALTSTLEQVLVSITAILRQQDGRVRLTGDVALAAARLAQLAQFLPPSDGFRQQLMHLHKLLPALLQPQTSEVQIRLLVPLWKLQQALAISLPGSTARWRSHASVPVAVMRLLSQWFCRRDAVAATLRVHCVHELAACGRTAQREPGVLAPIMAGFLAVLEFDANDSERQRVAEVLQELVTMLLVPTATTLKTTQCWTVLWQWQQQDQLPAGNTQGSGDLALLQAVQADLVQHRRQVLPVLQQLRVQAEDALLPYDLVILYCRLPWLLEAAGQPSFASLAHLWHCCLLQHWHQRLPITMQLLELLENTEALLDLAGWEKLQPLIFAHQTLRLLQLWPPSASCDVSSVPMTANGAEQVPLRMVPELLARSFRNLNKVEEQWFSNMESYTCHLQPLLAELRLLEQGAAAMKVQAVELFCSELLALHQRVQQWVPACEFPGALLWRLHKHLLDLLDEAAAWQDPQTDTHLLGELRLWQQRMVAETAQHHSPLDSCAAISGRLVRFMDTVAAAVEQPLRCWVEITPAAASIWQPQHEHSLQALLRFVVLERLQERTLRKHLLKPTTATMNLRIDGSKGGVAIELVEQGCEQALDPQALKKLQRKLPASMQQVQWLVNAGIGRSLSCVIAA